MRFIAFTIPTIHATVAGSASHPRLDAADQWEVDALDSHPPRIRRHRRGRLNQELRLRPQAFEIVEESSQRSRPEWSPRPVRRSCFESRKRSERHECGAQTEPSNGRKKPMTMAIPSPAAALAACAPGAHRARRPPLWQGRLAAPKASRSPSGASPSGTLRQCSSMGAPSRLQRWAWALFAISCSAPCRSRSFVEPSPLRVHSVVGGAGAPCAPIGDEAATLPDGTRRGHDQSSRFRARPSVRLAGCRGKVLRGPSGPARSSP